uniref:Uncharacterized protein n=1 Tax=Triticum urartu TaxID=4572 RepID=A0A8R7UH81_TRIUA
MCLDSCFERTNPKHDLILYYAYIACCYGVASRRSTST